MTCWLSARRGITGENNLPQERSCGRLFSPVIPRRADSQQVTRRDAPGYVLVSDGVPQGASIQAGQGEQGTRKGRLWQRGKGAVRRQGGRGRHRHRQRQEWSMTGMDEMTDLPEPLPVSHTSTWLCFCVAGNMIWKTKQRN